MGFRVYIGCLGFREDSECGLHPNMEPCGETLYGDAAYEQSRTHKERGALRHRPPAQSKQPKLQNPKSKALEAYGKPLTGKDLAARRGRPLYGELNRDPLRGSSRCRPTALQEAVENRTNTATGDAIFSGWSWGGMSLPAGRAAPRPSGSRHATYDGKPYNYSKPLNP